MARTHTVTRTDLTEHGNLRVGMTVTGPGRGRLYGPRERGTLIGLHVLHMARGDGYYAEVKRDDGTTYTTAFGLVSPVEDALPNGCLISTARRRLAEYDVRRRGGYKNQLIAARAAVKFSTGMGVRDLRKWLAENDR